MMKRKRRCFSLLLSLMMAAAMIPLSGLTAAAAPAATEVKVANASELRYALRATGNYTIYLEDDIDYEQSGDYDYWCTLGSGTKILYMTQHTIKIHNDDASASTLFKIPPDAELMIHDQYYDTNDDYVSVTYNGYINDEGKVRYRNLFDVYGRLDMGRGRYKAGRSKTAWMHFYFADGYYTKQTRGTGVIVRDGGTFIMNAGTLIGRGSDCAALQAENGATVYINDGELIGQGDADCIVTDKWEVLRIASGTFGTTKNPHPTAENDNYHSAYTGNIGIDTTFYAQNVNVSGSNPVTVEPGWGRCELLGKSGTATMEANQTLVYQFLDSDPVMMVDPATEDGLDYFRGFNDNVWSDVLPYAANHHRDYKWQILSTDKKVLAETEFTKNQSSINVMTGFSGFTPKSGERYIIRCSSVETLAEYRNRIVSYTCNPVDTFFEVQKDAQTSEKIPGTLYAGGQKNPAQTGKVLSCGFKDGLENIPLEQMHFQWQYRTGYNDSAKDIPGATTRKYVIEEAYAGQQIRVKLTVDGYSGYKLCDWWDVAKIKTSDVMLKITEPAGGMNPSYDVSYVSGARVKKVTWYNKELTERGIEEYVEMSSSAAFTAGKPYMVKIELYPEDYREFASQDEMQVILNNNKSNAVITALSEDSMTIQKVYTAAQNVVNPFVDVYESDDYYKAVLWAYYAEPQITNGIDEIHFGPKMTVTRGQAVTFLWRSMGCPEPSSSVNPFKDVSSSEYYYKPILWAVEKGITNGMTETTFEPGRTLSTAHMITFLYRTKNPGKDGWYQQAANWAGSDYEGKPFGVDIAVNDTTDCPRCNVVQFLQKVK